MRKKKIRNSLFFSIFEMQQRRNEEGKMPSSPHHVPYLSVSGRVVQQRPLSPPVNADTDAVGARLRRGPRQGLPQAGGIPHQPLHAVRVTKLGEEEKKTGMCLKKANLFIGKNIR